MVWKKALLAALIALPLSSFAAVYKCKGANGNTVFSEVPCGDDAQVQDVHAQPKINGAPAVSNGIGGKPLSQRDEAAACWLPKYQTWRQQYPQLAADPTQNLERMQQFQKECGWTPRSASRDTTPITPWPTAAQQTTEGSAASGFDAYKADAQKLESFQRGAPKAVRYSDMLSGALLKSVLNSTRVSPLLTEAIRQDGTQQFNDLKRILQSLLQRYSNAFEGSPSLYETEYLDCLEINTSVFARSMKQAMAETPKSTSSDAKLNKSMDQLGQGLTDMVRDMSRMFAKDLRQKISQGKFSPTGTQRAQGIANSLESM